jgi:thymidylate synthase
MYAKTLHSCSFPFAWQEAVNFVKNSKEKISFGGGKEVKHARDSQCTIILDRNAVQDVLNHVVHVSDPFATPLKLREYISEYTDAYPADAFDYTYYNILKNGFYSPTKGFLNQIYALRSGLEKQVDERLSSNRNVAILWNPIVHTYSKKAQPCWNEVMIRWIRDGEAQVYTHFRSHDLAAWESNMVAMIDFLNRDVVKPCGCEIVEIVESNFSLHIYDYDLDAMNNIKKLSVSPAQRLLQDKYDRINSPTIFDKYLDKEEL